MQATPVGGIVKECVGRRTSNLVVANSIPGHLTVTQRLGKSFAHVPLFTKQYQLVLAKGSDAPKLGR